VRAPAPVSATPFIPSPPIIVERDDGQYQIGLNDDAAGPFESRRFAESFALAGRGLSS
jgi:hypothetical protein